MGRPPGPRRWCGPGPVRPSVPMARTGGAELRFVPLEPPLERETALIWRKDRLHAPAYETFLQWLRQSLSRGASV